MALALIARYRDGEEFLSRFQPSFRLGGVFFPTRRVLQPGEQVVLDVRMPALRDGMLVRGTVVWRQRGQRGTGQRAGLGIEFCPGEEEKRDHLLALARGEIDPDAAQRRHRRVPTDLRAGWRVPNELTRHEGSVGDIGPGGAFLRTREMPAAGTSVLIELPLPGGGAAHVIEGRVAWTRSTPGAEGVGVEFRCRDLGGMRRLRELVRRIERDQARV